MKHAVLIDSSAWVAGLRQKGDPKMALHLEGLLQNGIAAMTQPVWVELFQGVRSRRDEQRLEELRESCVWAGFDDECWQGTASVGRKCVRAGVHVPLTDVMVFACARRYAFDLLECDQHFRLIAAAASS